MMSVKSVVVLCLVIAVFECRASKLDFSSQVSGWQSRSAPSEWDSSDPDRSGGGSYRSGSGSVDRSGRSEAWGGYRSRSPGFNARSFSGCSGARSSNGGGDGRHDQNAW